MSDDVKNQEEKVRSHNLKEVVISPDDAKAAFEFWPQFNVPPMEGLKEAFQQFQNDPTLENQNYLKYMVTKAIATTQHEAFLDPTFEKVRSECADVSYEMAFDRDFQNIIGEDKT